MRPVVRATALDAVAVGAVAVGVLVPSAVVVSAMVVNAVGNVSANAVTVFAGAVCVVDVCCCCSSCMHIQRVILT